MNEKQLFRNTWIKWSVIMGVATFALQVLYLILGLTTSWLLTTGISLAATIIMVIFAYKEYKAGNEGYMKYGRGIGLAALMGLIGGVVGGVLLALYIGVINPGMVNDIKKAQIESALEINENWNLGQSEDELIASVEERVTLKSTVTQFLYGSPIGGVLFTTLIALIVAAVMKSNPPNPSAGDIGTV